MHTQNQKMLANLKAARLASDDVVKRGGIITSVTLDFQRPRIKLLQGQRVFTANDPGAHEFTCVPMPGGRDVEVSVRLHGCDVCWTERRY